MPDTISVTPTSVAFNATLTPAQLAAVITAITGAISLSGFPAGKSLADATSLNIFKFTSGENEGGASVSGTIGL